MCMPGKGHGAREGKQGMFNGSRVEKQDSVCSEGQPRGSCVPKRGQEEREACTQVFFLLLKKVQMAW